MRASGLARRCSCRTHRTSRYQYGTVFGLDGSGGRRRRTSASHACGSAALPTCRRCVADHTSGGSDMLECVPTCRRVDGLKTLADLAAACGDVLLDLHVDADHRRSVFTLVGHSVMGLWTPRYRLAGACSTGTLIFPTIRGVHPNRVLDVCPFISLDVENECAVDAAAPSASGWQASRPRLLPRQRRSGRAHLAIGPRGCLRSRLPDFGPPATHPRLGGVRGARPVLVAVNCELADYDTALAADVARLVRERDGGLAGVWALEFSLTYPGRNRVSMNLVDVKATGNEEACWRSVITPDDWGRRLALSWSDCCPPRSSGDAPPNSSRGGAGPWRYDRDPICPDFAGT